MADFMAAAPVVAIWTAIFFTFAVGGYVRHMHGSVFMRQTWMTLHEVDAPVGDDQPIHTAHRREFDRERPAYKKSKRGMVLDAEEAAWRLSAFAWLALPGGALVLLGLAVWGSGLLGAPLLIVALRCHLASKRLAASHPAFIEDAPTLRFSLIAASLFTVVVVIGWALVIPPTLGVLFPVLVACLFALDVARHLPPAAEAMRANLETRGVSEGAVAPTA
jgi:hypothetical protein